MVILALMVFEPPVKHKVSRDSFRPSKETVDCMAKFVHRDAGTSNV
jgi:hypothetical protein